MVFQFHKGTIKTPEYFQLGEQFDYFNSIKVRLKLRKKNFLEAALIDFNSIKVRLKLNQLANLDMPFLFQFHKGTIKTR